MNAFTKRHSSFLKRDISLFFYEVLMRVEIDYKLESWNDIIKDCRSNRYFANGKKQKEMENISYKLKKIPKITKYPIKVICEWHIKDCRSDLDNKSIKSTLDCLQRLDILENDNCNHIEEIIYKYVKDDRDYLVLEIKEKEND